MVVSGASMEGCGGSAEAADSKVHCGCRSGSLPIMQWPASRRARRSRSRARFRFGASSWVRALGAAPAGVGAARPAPPVGAAAGSGPRRRRRRGLERRGRLGSPPAFSSAASMRFSDDVREGAVVGELSQLPLA